MKILPTSNVPWITELQGLGHRHKPLFSIIFENHDFLIVQKNSGLAVQTTDHIQRDLETLLKEKYGQNIFVLNRIDQPVTGLVIFARNKSFADLFSQMIKERKIRKEYLAIVSGQQKLYERVLAKHYIKKLHNRSMTSDEPMDSNYKEAILYYTPLQHFDHYSLLHIELVTGRFHQIRAQMATLGMPVKGDLKYGSKRPNIDKSICLLSYKLQFIHPVTGEQFSFTSEIPDNDVLWSLIDPEILKQDHSSRTIGQ
jgi:23S rRNA pseudouridine1911/1915/1917 synthase